MRIKISVKETDSRLFCASKFWGDPDMPEQMQYPMVEVVEDGESYDYPLTFVCQIDCAEVAALGAGSVLPEEGMLYFFAAFDEFLGYDSPVKNGIGKWPKGHVMVKYAKAINYETFQSQIMVDDEDNPIADPPVGVEFLLCDEDDQSITLAEHALGEEIALLRLVSDEGIGLVLPEGTAFTFAISESDLKFGNWKRAYGKLEKR